jgi:hypothetical protein
MFNLGTATFNQISISQPTYAISSGAFFLAGAIGSANINTGGRGVITLGGFTGAGTILSGITIGDALWEFHHNDDIQDTRPDALLSMQANATVTIIVTSGIYVKVAGLWSDFGKSQFNVTTDGRATYVGGKSARLPITFSLTSEPVSGNAKKISYKVAINGIIIDGSKRSGSSDAGFPTSVTIPWQYTFNTGDYVEIFATNDTDSIDILCSSAVARIN